MNIDPLTFRAIAQAVLPPGALGRPETALTAGEAAAIVRLGYLASGADLDEDSDELALRDQLGQHICALAGISFATIPRPSPLPLPNDDEARHAWLQQLRSELVTPGARELAYVHVYLLAVSDLELAPVESALLSELPQVLGISDARADEIIATAAAQVTPMQSSGAGSEQPSLDG